MGRTDATDIAEANAALYWERDMSKPYTGGCACGATRYEIWAKPIAMNDFALAPALNRLLSGRLAS